MGVNLYVTSYIIHCVSKCSCEVIDCRVRRVGCYTVLKYTNMSSLILVVPTHSESLALVVSRRGSLRACVCEMYVLKAHQYDLVAHC